MPTSSLATVPSGTTIITYVGGWSGPTFDNLLPIGLSGVGFVIAGLAIAFILSAVVAGVMALFHRPSV